MEQNTELKTQPRIASPFIDTLVDKRSHYYFSKRAVDVVASIMALIVSLPFMLVIAILIRLDSAGPVFFAQQRVGSERLKVNGKWIWQKRLFTCYKFRTMFHKSDTSVHQAYIKALINNDEHQQAVIQSSDPKVKKMILDVRITRIGRYLRRSSLDELPQFWNILKGEMSLVGPRPSIPYEVEMYKPRYYQRLNTKPGLTGLWQVSGRSTLGFDEMVDLDIQYIQLQSFMYDLKIIIKTPFVILSRKGAA